MYTGASGAIPRTDIKRMDVHANLFYEAVRNRTGDIEKIANNTGFSEQDIAKIKEHIFFNKYLLDGKLYKRFDPDYDMAVSWQRLTEGTSIQEMDLVLLRHELLECHLMNDEGLDYRSAHDKAELVYSFTEYVRAMNKEAGLL